MKKSVFVILAVFLAQDAFSQYFNTTQIGMLMGNRPMNDQSYNSATYDTRTYFQMHPSVTMTNGGRIDEHWALGVGVGFEIFDRNLFPVFIDIRNTLRENGISPFFAFKIGYAVCGFKKKHYDNLSLPHEPYYVNNAYLEKNGGLMVHPEMGVKVPLTENADLLFTVAYRYQKTKLTVSQDFGRKSKWEHEESMNRLSFGVGISFK